MNRRTVLTSAIGLASTMGLAGCSGPLSEESSEKSEVQPASEDGSCSKPAGSLEDALPDSDGYELSRGPNSYDGDEANAIEGATEAINAYYTNPDFDLEFSFNITVFESADAAQEALENAFSGEDMTGDRAVGYLVVDNYLYQVSGPNEEEATEFMATAEPLNSECVNSNVEFR